MIGERNEFCFPLDGQYFEGSLELMKSKVTSNALNIFENLNSLESLYNYQIIPILESKIELPNVGTDWAFDYLKLCRIVHNSNYSKLKSTVLTHIEIMKAKNEPNMIEYYPILTEIFAEIEK